jgi:hypothetical protein
MNVYCKPISTIFVSYSNSKLKRIQKRQTEFVMIFHFGSELQIALSNPTSKTNNCPY